MNEHFDIDDRLRAAMRREEAPAGFAGRVLARTQPVPPRPRRAAMYRWTWAAAAFAACLTLAIGLGEYRREAAQRARGLEAKQELMQAMRITGSKLRVAQEKVRHLNE